ncbi:MAG: sialate O-acetylesterase [Cyanobacteria bacterium P01_A01_bin.40]
MKAKLHICLFFSLACSLVGSLFQFSPMIAPATANSSTFTKLNAKRNFIGTFLLAPGNRDNAIARRAVAEPIANAPQNISSGGQLSKKPLVFVLMGQSNACGAADIQDTQEYLTQHPNIRKYIQSTSNSGEKFTQTLVPFCEQWKDNSDGKASLMNSFLQRMVQQFPQQKFDVLNCSIPGSSIQSYKKGTVVNMNFYGNDFQTGDSNIYEHCVRRTREVLNQGGGTLAGVLFHQGESDNAASYWKPAVENVVLNFRQDLDSNVPFIFGHLVPVPQYEDHNQIIDSLENTSNLIGVVSSQGLSYQSDNIHFDEQGSLGLGYRYAEEMLKFLRNEEDISNTQSKK